MYSNEDSWILLLEDCHICLELSFHVIVSPVCLNDNKLYSTELTRKGYMTAFVTVS